MRPFLLPWKLRSRRSSFGRCFEYCGNSLFSDEDNDSLRFVSKERKNIESFEWNQHRVHFPTCSDDVIAADSTGIRPLVCSKADALLQEFSGFELIIP